MFTVDQKNILIRAKFDIDLFTETRIFEIKDEPLNVSKLTDADLLQFLNVANALYRGGSPIITDAEYDFTYLNELKARDPSHEFLKSVEPEVEFVGKTVLLPSQMLSTEKAYSFDEIKKWVNRIKKAALEESIKFDEIKFRVTAKLDGYAAYDDGKKLYTRGDGKRGTDITRVFERGMLVANNNIRGLGAGEIVVNKKYFNENLATHFENSRNFQSSVVKEKDLDDHVLKAIQDGAAIFYPFVLLPSWEGYYLELESHFEDIVEKMRSSVDYDIDGVILEICNDDLKKAMGSTRQHNKWQIAYKKNNGNAQVKVLNVVPQTSRSGRVNPVAEIEPTRLSGAMINRATAHHYGMVKKKGIGPGAIIELTRSGEVIPKIVSVIVSVVPEIPPICPSCQTELVWEGDYLYCINNIECSAQISNSIEHFFKTLGNIDGFGTATIEKLYENGIKSVFEIYKKSVSEFEVMGFGPKQSQNLYNELIRSRVEKIEDWRFLAAFGVFRMAGGNCERLLNHFRLKDVFDLTKEQIIAIEGFAEKTAEAVTKGFNKIYPIFNDIFSLGFNLEETKLLSESNLATTAISGKLIVFTGSFTLVSREEMLAKAKKLGAKVGSSVTGKTDILVTGENVGVKKISNAESIGVKILTEQQYLGLIS